MKADAFPCHLDGVAVDDPWLAGDVGKCRGGNEER
jgi:hypothetical protein